MTKTNSSITQKRLKELLHYDPDTGLFKWMKSIGSRAQKGNLAGTIQESGRTTRLVIMINKTRYKAHRLAVLYITGDFPIHEVDHIDGNALNNCWDNLRLTTHQENSKNQRIRINNTSGIMGVRWYDARKKWHVRISIDGKEKHLGYYVNFKDAVKTRKAAERKYNFHPLHGTDKVTCS